MFSQLQNLSFLNHPFFWTSFLNNSTLDWLKACLIFIITLTLLKIFKTILIARATHLTKKTKTRIDDIVINAINAIHWPFYIFLALYASITFLNTPEIADKTFYYTFLILASYYAVKFLQEFVELGAQEIIKRQTESGEGDNLAIIQVISSMLKLGLWLGALLMVLANLGYNINSLIAGLGIGGIAIALALQNILGDIFSSFSIFFDKPFRVGDFIAVGDHKGTVKKIGIKTTRIESIMQGEELVISNNELTKTKLQNYGLMEKRRVAFSIHVDPETPVSKLKKIPETIRKTIEAQENAEVARIHFGKIEESRFVFEILYYVTSPDYNVYMDIQQNINLKIVSAFAKEKIKFARPTQTVYLDK